MRRQPQRALLLAAALAAGAVVPWATAATPDDDARVLVRYDFDRDDLATGPYTLIVFEHSRGTVELTSAYRFSGRRSVEIRDVAGDGAFAELQGFFPERRSGKLFVHFALMTAEPSEDFHVALAGTAHFAMREQGFGFWLKNDGGTLFHVSDRQDRELFAPRAFTWYLVDVAYDVDAGTYDLTIHEEGVDAPRVRVTGQPNAVGLPGSGLVKFSFIGDPPWEDDSDGHIFVDDIVITADRPVRRGPFVAPGRRMLFVDMWDHHRKQLARRPGCPPMLGEEDLGLGAVDLQALSDAGALGKYRALVEGRAPRGALVEPLPAHLEDALRGLALWRRACFERSACPGECAVDTLAEATGLLPDSKLVPMGSVMALASAARWAEADELLLRIYPDWQADPRYPAIAAVLGLARGRLEEAEEWLRGTPEELTAKEHPALRRLWSGSVGPSLVAELRSSFPADWHRHVETALAAEHRYYVLLWQGRLGEARAYAERMARRFDALSLPAGRWREREADAAFQQRDPAAALRLYERALRDIENPVPVLLKLSDVHFRLGDLELERAYREKIYGTLEPKATRRDPAPDVSWELCPPCPGSE